MAFDPRICLCCVFRPIRYLLHLFFQTMSRAAKLLPEAMTKI